MLIPKKNRRLIYEQLFKEGVMVAKKDFNLPKHPEVDVPNLQVIKSMQVSGGKWLCEANWGMFWGRGLEPEVTWLRQGAVLMAVVLLVPDQ